MSISLTLDPAQLRAAALFAASKDIRYYLNGVLLEIRPREGRLVATDGMALSIQRVERETSATADVIIPISAIAALKSFKAAVLPVEISDDGKSGVLGGVAFEAIDGRYPDYRRAIPRDLDGVASQFDPEQLMRFHKAAKILGARGGAFHLRYNGEEGSAVVQIHDPRFLGIVMPRRKTEGFITDYSWSAK